MKCPICEERVLFITAGGKKGLQCLNESCLNHQPNRTEWCSCIDSIVHGSCPFCEDMKIVFKSAKAKTDKVETGLILIPFYSILRIGAIFIEGLRYGKDNWKKGVNDKEYQEERLEHAFLHLIKYKEGDTSENHLAKVAWFCVIQMELQRLEGTNDVLCTKVE
jgi:hypothetical protein